MFIQRYILFQLFYTQGFPPDPIFAEVPTRGSFFVKFEVSLRQQFASDPDSAHFVRSGTFHHFLRPPDPKPPRTST